MIIEPTRFELKPGDSRAVTLRFQVPVNADPTVLPVYSGFIYVANQANGEVEHLSCELLFVPLQLVARTYVSFYVDAGVVGDYAKAKIIVRNSSSDYITGILNAHNDFIVDGGEPALLNVTEGVSIMVVLAWPTRLFFGEIISISDNNQPSLNVR